MPLFQLCLIIFSAFTKLSNSKFLINYPHHKRFAYDSVWLLGAFLLTGAMATWKFEAGFYIILVSAIMHGMGAAFSESTAYGWIKGFPGHMVGNFSSGTGMSGLLGTFCLLFFKSFTFFEENEGVIFFIMAFLLIPYLFAMFWLHNKKSTLPFIVEAPIQSS